MGTGENNPLSWRANIFSSTRLMWSPDMEFCGYATWSNGWETNSIHSPEIVWRIVALIVTVAHSCISWSSQLIKISIDLSIDELIKVNKSDLIDIDCIDQSLEIDGTLFSFIDLS